MISEFLYKDTSDRLSPNWMNIVKTAKLRLVLGVAILAVTVLPADAQQSQATAPPAERAFIANAGGDFGVGISVVGVVEGGTASKAYNEFFNGMKNWGRYEIVANPARADWLFEISVRNDQSCYVYPRERRREIGYQNNYRIEVVMLEVKSPGTARKFVEPIKTAGLFSDPAKIFDRGIASLIDDVKQAVGEHGAKTAVATLAGPLGPVPPKIGLGRKAFINNAGTDASGEKYSGGKDQVYNKVFDTIKKSGRYEIVSSAGEADLIFDVSFFVEPSCTRFGDPQLKLALVEPGNNVLLWGFTTHVETALLEGNARKNFTQGVSEMVAVVRELAERPTWNVNDSIAATPQPAPVTMTVIPSAEPPIPITISGPSETVKSGSNFQVKVTVRNMFKQDLKFTYPSDDPLTCMVAVHNAKGELVSDTLAGTRLKTAHAGWKAQPASYTLNPGETQTRQCEVSDLYDMTAAGKYSIEVQQLDGRPVQSNVVTVTVIP